MEYKTIIENDRYSYRVYIDGTIIRNGRIGANGNIIKERKLVPHINSSGYYRVGMVLNGVRKDYFVHRIVASLFCDNPNGYTVVDHKDGNKLNNHADNLEWVSSGENNRRAFANGLKPPTVHYGETHPMAKLTWDDVDFIRSHYIKGDKTYGQCGLAKMFNTTQSNIYEIVNYRIWARRITPEGTICQ